MIQSLFTYFTDYSKYYDILVCLVEELETLIPQYQPQIAALIGPIKCQQISVNTNDQKLALKCLEDFTPKIVGSMLKYK